ncbi:MAG: entericidin A/B family lipoprotein [Pseudomonadota bacterium]
MRLILLMATALVMLASGCNTLDGIGRDVEAGGRALQRTF